ncbi:sensor histidine kinase [Actinoplanes sp. GCM10030250]|uniref:sensor histidine kinase n=1 Tax=Actinoplanes sp. GCM10030250 TaxID=3273376 RepID=UPI00360C0164
MDVESSGTSAMIVDMNRRWGTALAGLGGCLLIAMLASKRGGQFSPMLGVAGPDAYYGPNPITPLVPTAATVLALCLLRWWPYLLPAAGLLSVPLMWPQLLPDRYPIEVFHGLNAAFPVLVVAVLGAAQSLLSSGSPGLGAAVAGLAAGSVLFGHSLPGMAWEGLEPDLSVWHGVLLVTGLTAIAPAAWHRRRGDRDATGVPEGRAWSGRRLRLVVTGGLAALIVLPIAMISAERLGALLDVSWTTLSRYPYTKSAILGALTLAAVLTVTAFAGLWSLAAALTAATAQIAVSAPLFIAFTAMNSTGPMRWFGAAAGVAIGAACAASRWRIPAAATLAVSTATSLFIAYAATSGHPEKLADQHRVVPALVMLVLATAAATAVVGAAAPVLAPRGAVPVVLGPIAGVLAVAGAQTVPVIYLGGGQALDSPLSSRLHFDTAAVLLLAVAAAIGGLGVAHYLSERWAERKRAELIRQEAAAAERDRLARPIHDGVLQVLALVQREGSELGGSGARLAALAGEQETALRNLLCGTTPGERGEVDLRSALSALSSPVLEVSSPATPVALPAERAAELIAAVRAALDNVREHAGPAARTWILLEDEDDGVRVTVRDDGAGFEPRRLAEAASAGRLGVAQSMRGRIGDLGGTTTIHSRPGDGTEVEFWVPRR